MKYIKSISFIFIGLGLVLLFIKQPGLGFFTALGSLILIITHLFSAIKHFFKGKFYKATGDLIAVFTLISFVLGIYYWSDYRNIFLLLLVIFLILFLLIGIIKRKLKIQEITVFTVVLSVITILNFIPFYLFTEYSQLKYMPEDLDSNEICGRLFRYMTEINKVEKNELILKYIDLYESNCSFSKLPSPYLDESKRDYDIKILDGDFELTKTTKLSANVRPFSPDFEKLHIIPGNNCIFEQRDEYTKVIPYSGDSVFVQLVVEDKFNNEWFLIASKKYKIKKGANNGEHP